MDSDRVENIKKELWRPFEVLDEAAGTSTKQDINPNYILPKQALHRLQKIMDEYAAGQGAAYTTNEPTLLRGMELMEVFRQDLHSMAARDLHDLLRCWEVWDRFWCAQAHMQHLLYRKETRWPGCYYRGDYPKLDEENWKCFVNSQYDPAKNEWTLSKKPYVQLIP